MVENREGLVVLVGDNVSPLVEIVLADLPKKLEGYSPRPSYDRPEKFR